MVNTRKSAKSSVKSAEKRKESMQTSKAVAAKSKVPKSKAAEVKKASALQEKPAEEVTAEIPQTVTMDSTTQACPPSKVTASLPSTSANIPTVENFVLKEVVNVNSGEVVKSGDRVEASRAGCGEARRAEVGIEASWAKIGVDKGSVVTGDAGKKGDDGSMSVKETEPRQSVTRGPGVSDAWRAKIQSSGYIRPGGFQRKKVTHRAASPRQCIAKISSIRRKLSGTSEEEGEKSVRKLVIEDTPIDGTAAEIRVSESNQGNETGETVSKKAELSVKDGGVKDTISEEPETAEGDVDLTDVFKDIDDFVEDLQKEVPGVPTGMESVGVPVPEERLVEETVSVPAAVQDSLNCDQMEVDASQKTASEAATQMDDDQDLVPLVQIKKMTKCKGKKKVVFEIPVKGSVRDAAEVGSVTGGAGVSKKRKREVPVPVSEDAGKCKVPSPTEDSAPVGVVKHGVWFVNKDAARKWSCVQKRKIIPERLLDESRYKGKEVIEVLKESELFWTLDRCKPFNEQLVREAIVNLPPGFGSVGEAEFGVFFVRGRRITLDPELINVYFSMDNPELDEEEPCLEKVVRTITAGSVQWRPETVVNTAELSTFYSMLYFIAVFNWRPSTHRSTVNRDVAQLIYQIGNKLRVNMGRIMFRQIAEHATSMRSLHQICFPSLIYELIIHQAPDLQVSSDLLTKAPSKFTVDHKLFKGRHVNDLKGGSKRGKEVGESSRGGAKMGVDERSKLLKDLQAIIAADKEQRHRINRLARALSYPSDDESEATASAEDSIEEASD